MEVALHLSLNADVTVTGKRTFTNLADAADPAQNLVGIAQSASQGAITARQLDARPIMRAGEVLETVPGVVISQHSGEGKANQYYLRGFNLDHGTDFATTVAGHAGQHADARPRARLFGPELPDPRAGQRRPVFEGARTSPTRATSRPPAPPTSTTPTRSTGRSCASAAATRDSARAARRRRRRVGGGHLLGGARARAQRRSLGPCPTTIGRSTASSATASGDARQRLLDHRHGLSRRPGTRPTRCRSAPSTTGLIGRFGAIDPTRRRRHLPLQRLVRVAARRAATPRRKVVGLRHRLRPQSVLQLHLLPRRSGARRPVPSGRPSLRHRRQGQPPPARRAGAGRVDAEHVRRAAPQRRHHERRPLSHRGARSCSTRCARTRWSQTSAGGLRAERDGVGAVAAHAGRAPRRRLPLRRRRRRSRRTAARRAPGSSARRAAW